MAERAVFLSASVPDPKRHPKYYSTADIPAIRSSVSALCSVVLGRLPLVWGGHPSITPIVALAASSRQVEYGHWVHIYQSKFFEADFPEDNRKFKNVILTPSRGLDRVASLAEMRRRMFRDNTFVAGIFIGGMEGIEDEFEMFRECWPKARLLPVASTGAAARRIYDAGEFDPALATELTYASMFERLLADS